MCLYKIDTEYASGTKYVKVLNMTSSQYTSVTQRSEYARICLDRVLNISWVLNMQGL